MCRYLAVWLLGSLVLLAGCSESKEPEAAVSPRQVTAPATQPQLTYRERKEQGLLTPQERRVADEIAKMQEENKQYEQRRAAGKVKYVPPPAPDRPVKYVDPPIPSVYSSPEEAAEADRLREQARQYVRQQQALQQGRWVGKYQVEHMPGETAAEYQQRCRDVQLLQDPRLPALIEQMMEREQRRR